MDMAREIDLSKPLSEADVTYLQARLPQSRVRRMIEMAGGTAQDASETPEEPEEPEDTPEGTEDAAEAEEGSEEPDEDLIGEPDYDPLQHTTTEVRKYLKEASAEEQARVKAVEQSREDREPRTSILNYDPS